MPWPSSTLPTAIDTVPSASILIRCGSFSGLFTRGLHHGAHHAVVRSAAAEVLVQGFLDFPFTGGRLFFEKSCGRNDDSAHAVTALGCLLGDERLLDPAVQSFYGGDGLSGDEGNRQVAGSHRPAVDHDEARAALATAAAEARADQSQVVAQH